MSAYIVSKAHIDAIVTFAVGGTRRVGTVKRMAEDAGHGKYVSSSDYTPSQIGAALWAENHASVDHRYTETTPAPAYVFRPTGHGSACSKPTRLLTPLDIINYAQCAVMHSGARIGAREPALFNSLLHGDVAWRLHIISDLSPDNDVGKREV